MMSKWALIFLLLTQIGWSQQAQNLDKLKENPKTVSRKTFSVVENQIASVQNYYSIENYTKSGKLQRVQYFGNDDVLDSEELYSYDKNGNLVKEELYKAQKKRDKTTLFEYDADGRLITEKKLDQQNKVLIQTTCQYDIQGRLIIKKQWFTSIDYTVIERFAYNESGQLTETFKETPAEISREQFLYNDSGQLLEKAEINAKNEKFSTILYEYNDKGDKTALYKFDPSGEMTYFEQYEYQYDVKNNWTEKKIFIKGDWKSLEKREINYF